MNRTPYAWLLRLITPLLLIYLAGRALLDRRYRDRWWQRFGFVPRASEPPIWVHAVSVGESLAAVPLVQALRARYPEHPILMTTVTPTGAEVVQQRLKGLVRHVYAPYDLPFAVRRFLKRNRPLLGIVMETEVWPNLYHAAACLRVPMALVNARLSDRSSKGYRRFIKLIGPALRDLALIAAQSEDDAARFRALGAGNVYVTGNLKFDLPDQSESFVQGRALRRAWGGRQVWVFGSTHEGEEALALDVLDGLRTRFPDLLLVLVPRHPQRFEAVAALIEARGLSFVRHGRKEVPQSHHAVLLGDTLGELSGFYAAADVVTVGGSFVPVGGHNVLEPAALGKPVSFGPYMHNFREIRAKLLAADAGIEVPDAQALQRRLQDWLAQPQAAQAVGANGMAVVDANRGALAWTLKLLPFPDRG
ncbi:lipid IV(A) 3-deoxy-D-manno-octulosonic acid transferase [Thermithiobacillus plumbiphilus]|uniref:3-deoxy-D-manno-octulosonic acid transferase n=1 Tax=Thermithiobacillus plumbiphilus TaxID=1729899 RepID=A0ABU9DDA1_9PROT